MYIYVCVDICMYIYEYVYKFEEKNWCKIEIHLECASEHENLCVCYVWVSMCVRVCVYVCVCAGVCVGACVCVWKRESNWERKREKEKKKKRGREGDLEVAVVKRKRERNWERKKERERERETERKRGRERKRERESEKPCSSSSQEERSLCDVALEFMSALLLVFHLLRAPAYIHRHIKYISSSWINIAWLRGRIAHEHSLGLWACCCSSSSATLRGPVYIYIYMYMCVYVCMYTCDVQACGRVAVRLSLAVCFYL